MRLLEGEETLRNGDFEETLVLKKQENLFLFKKFYLINKIFTVPVSYLFNKRNHKFLFKIFFEF